ncbi:MAG: RHS repeat-associated core domain-containing protein, partial [Deltaproteobacteria bacterium]|nr:RHS repeat-associated core domain-containing protein [Deltaproteobacteria bacterium]
MIKVTPQANEAHTTNLFRLQEMLDRVQAAADGLHDIPYEDLDATAAVANAPYRRLIEHTRTLFREDDLSAPLPLGKVKPLALPYESYKLAFTPGLLAVFGDKISPADVTALLINEGKYRDLDSDGQLWIPSGQSFFSADPANPDPAFARNHFYLPQCVQDPFGNVSSIIRDGYDLLPVQTTDPVGSTVFAEHDYRVLKPVRVTDLNGNRADVAFDVLGLVAATAVMGKTQEPDGKPKGDTLQGFVPDLSAAQVAAFFSDPHGQAAAILGPATTRIVYNIDRFKTSGQPICVVTLARETHVQDLSPGQLSLIQLNISYSDGFGRELQKKVQAEPGQIDDAGPSVNPRWVGSGWVIFNNKGKPVKQYEPFFSATHDFEFAIQRGVGVTSFYDPAGRVMATLHPNHTYEKVLFDPWAQQHWDVNDTVTRDPAADPDISAYFLRLAEDEYHPTWYALRAEAAYATQAAQRWPDATLRGAEAGAANKAAVHANTPATQHVDTLGRTFLMLDDNGGQEVYANRIAYDIEGNQRSVTDALGRKVMSYDYGIAGGTLRQYSMDAGVRWLLYDVAGKSIRLWDSRGHTFRSEYDALHRPVHAFVQGADPQDPSREMLLGKTIYGEGQANDTAFNMRGKEYLRYDGAGIVTNHQYDFKGNLLSSSRQLLHDYKSQVDWSQSPFLETEIFFISKQYDALNRTIQAVAPHSDAANVKLNIIQPIYNEANLLERLDVWLQEANAPATLLDAVTANLHAITNIDYNAKGQRTAMEYGNGTSTRYGYDDQTFRLLRLQTLRSSDNIALQDLHYSYDPIGNMTHIQDDADIQNVVYFRNRRVEPSADYKYDALYRLIQARGREHLGSSTPTSANDAPRTGLLQPSDGTAMGRYEESYLYDAVGNILETRHRGTDPAHAGWKRCYQYAVDSNRLLSIGSPNDPNTPDSDCPLHYAAQPVFAERYDYDTHGNMRNMPQLNHMDWDCKNQLRHVDLGGGGDAYYVYDAAGQRMRKVVERQTGARQHERIYLGGFEVYREYDGAGVTVTLERETLHVMDGKQRLAFVETRTQGKEDIPLQLVRFQLGNHIGSASLELDDLGAVISYEEYYPYGSSSYQAGRSGVEVGLKRYRYTGMERDEETGLTNHGARYYAPWLGRWTAADPIGIKDSLNAYRYVSNNPITKFDTNGLWEGDMHFMAVYWAGRMQGATHKQAMEVAAASNFLDDEEHRAPNKKAHPFDSKAQQVFNNSHALHVTKSESQILVGSAICRGSLKLLGF